VVDYQRYLTQEQPDSLGDRQTWFAERLPEMIKQLPPEQQATGRLIEAEFAQQKDDIDALADTLSLIKEQEDD